MSVDYYVCDSCGSTYCDCGYYVECECGKSWCSDDCASDDDYKRESCKLGLNVENQYLVDDSDKCIRQEDEDGNINCYECENYIPESCKYCRNEDFADEELLGAAIRHIGCDRQFLINLINEGK